ncbi:MAG: hypothetical protein ACE5FF_06220 [Saprospiraceae bacterium]
MSALKQSRFFRRDFFVFLLLLTGAHLLFGGTVRAGFVTDFTGLQWRLDGAPFSDVLNCFGFPALHQVTNFFLYIFYRAFGTNGLPWYLVYTTLHVTNGFMGYKLGEKIFARSGIAAPHIPALMASLLFVFNPYSVETVVWKVCFNYLFCTLLMFGSLWQLLRYLESPNHRSLVLSHLFFVLALFTFELALAFPLVALALTFAWQQAGPGRRRFLKFYFVPQSLLLTLYFLLNKLLLGTWVGHYGAAVHLKFNVPAIAGNLLRYFTKYGLFWREWPHGKKEALMQFFDHPATGWAALVIGAVLLAAGVYFYKKCPFRLRHTGGLWLLFFVALLPVSNLYVAWILHGENDRYGYFASLFFFMGLSVLLLYLPKILRYGAFATLLLLSVFFLNRTVNYWENGSRVFYSLLKDFRWPDAPEVYVLAFPENYQGIPVFKDFSKRDMALKDALKYGAGKEVKGRIFQVAQFNMTSPEDGVNVKTGPANRFSVTFNQWGNWWWRNGIGTWNYETKKYRFTVEGNGSRVEMKDPAPGAVFIYSVGGKWYEP